MGVSELQPLRRSTPQRHWIISGKDGRTGPQWDLQLDDARRDTSTASTEYIGVSTVPWSSVVGLGSADYAQFQSRWAYSERGGRREKSKKLHHPCRFGVRLKPTTESLPPRRPIQINSIKPTSPPTLPWKLGFPIRSLMTRVRRVNKRMTSTV
jgi:hypothetical protein